MTGRGPDTLCYLLRHPAQLPLLWIHRYDVDDYRGALMQFPNTGVPAAFETEAEALTAARAGLVF